MGILLANARLVGRPEQRVDLRIDDGRIVALGPDVVGESGDERVDAGGRAVMGGLRDAHTHFTHWALSRRELDLSRTRSAGDAADLVVAAVNDPHSTSRRAGVITGGGFEDGFWPDQPHKDVLDRAAPGVPVVLHSHDMHTAWMSSAALALVGLPEHETGLLPEDVAWRAIDRLPQPSEAEQDAAVREAVRHAASLGVTEIVDYEFSRAYPTWARRAAEWDEAVGLRVWASVRMEDLDEALERGWRTGTGNGLVRVGSLKLFVDGALGSRTALCDHDYPDRPGYRGIQITPPDRLHDLIGRAHAGGLRASVHAIGDAANRIALDAFERVGCGGRIEHAQMVDDADLPRFAALGVEASVQPVHAPSDRDLADQHWSGQDGTPFPYRSLLDAGTRMVFGSDAPVEPLQPWQAIGAAVTRTDDERPPWMPEERLPLDIALGASSARRVAVGEPADLAVLDADPTTVPEQDLATMTVWATMVDGRWTHRGG
jgi:hypothetical protein